MKTIKKSIIVRDIQDYKINRQIKKSHQPVAGDVAVFKVEKIGKHSSIQGGNGNNTYIFPGDYIMAAFGNRYATGQFEGYVPTGYHARYQILGKGGAVGILHSMNAKFDKIGATTLKLVGYAVDEFGKVKNTKNFYDQMLRFNPYKERPYKVILSVGSSMDSGKTTSAGFLCRGLRNAKHKVAYIKLTGTVYTKDRSFVRDCGAHIVTDFSHQGFPSTYMCDMDELLDLHETLLQRVQKVNPDYVVIEIADGLLQRETWALINDYSFMNTVDEIFLSCGDSMSVMTGIDILSNIGLKPFAVGGLFTASPLLAREVREFSDLPVLGLDELISPDILMQYLQRETVLTSSLDSIAA